MSKPQVIIDLEEYNNLRFKAETADKGNYIPLKLIPSMMNPNEYVVRADRNGTVLDIGNVTKDNAMTLLKYNLILVKV